MQYAILILIVDTGVYKYVVGIQFDCSSCSLHLKTANDLMNMFPDVIFSDIEY